MLRARRKELEEKMKREGKLNEGNMGQFKK